MAAAWTAVNIPRIAPRLSALFGIEQRCGPEQGGVGAHDDEGWDGCEVGAQAALVLEARAELRARERLSEPRHDAAGDIDAAAGPERQRQVAGNRAKHGAEHGRRLFGAC